VSVQVVRFTVVGQPEAASRGLGRPYTIVYDGNCKVCGRLVKLLRAWDRRNEIEVVPSQLPGVMARFPWIPARAYAEAVQLIGPDNHT
jgi:predicted DCC family thiol-disulfide oxidoreductase YuxK